MIPTGLLFGSASQKVVTRWLVADGVLDPLATNNGTVTSAGAARFSPGAYVTVADSVPDVTLGTSDFTIGAEFSLQGTVPNQGSSFTDFIFWSPFAAPSQGMNYEFGYNHGSGQFHFSVNNSGNATYYRVFSFALALNTAYKVEMTREAGILALWVNGTKVGESAFTLNISHNVITPMVIGRRIGGTAADVIWNSNMTLKNLYVTKQGRSKL